MTTKSEDALVEKVAKAIFALTADQIGADPSYATVPERSKIQVREVARAALEASGITTLLERERRLREALQTFVTARDRWLKTRWDSDEEAVAGMAFDDAHEKARAALTGMDR